MTRCQKNSRRSKIWMVLWGVIVAIAVACWVTHSCQLVQKYKENRWTKVEELEHRDALPFPALLLCNRYPFNESRLTNSGIWSTDMVRYLNEFTNPGLDEHEESPPWDERSHDSTHKLFVRHFNRTGRNVSSIQQLLYDCESMVESCRVAGKELSGPECCQRVEIKATPAGFCFLFQPPGQQKKSGSKQGFKVRLEVHKVAYKKQGKPEFDLFIHQKHLLAGLMDKPIALGEDKKYLFKLELEEEQIMSSFCRQHRNKRRRRKNHHKRKKDDIEELFERDDVELQEHMEKRMACLHEQVLNSCQCGPGFSLADELGPYEGPICTANASRHCVKPWVDYWRSSHAYGEMMKDDVCPQQLPCSRLRWQVSPANLRKPKIPHRQTYYIYEFTVYYDSMIAKMVTIRPTITLHDLVTEIASSACIWFVLLHILHSLATAISCCCCKKKEAGCSAGDDHNPHQTHIPPSLIGEKYQQTQTE